MRALETLPPTEPLEIGNGLTLVPRVKLKLTVFPQNPSVAKAVDEWKLKRALIDFLKTSLSPAVTVPEEDLEIRRHRDLKKRKRDDPIAHGTLFVRDLGFLKPKKKEVDGEESNDLEKEKKFIEWRKYLVEKLDGIELHLEGTKYKLSIAVPVSDEFERMRKEFEEFFTFGSGSGGGGGGGGMRGRGRGRGREADTIIVRGVPSRWFAEPRVSSKPSMLVTHTIFSNFGKIR